MAACSWFENYLNGAALRAGCLLRITQDPASCHVDPTVASRKPSQWSASKKPTMSVYSGVDLWGTGKNSSTRHLFDWAETFVDVMTLCNCHERETGCNVLSRVDSHGHEKHNA